MYQLTIEPLGATIEVEEGQTVLDAALRQGIYLPHACGHGLCGSCKVQVCSGEVDHGAANPFALMDFERDEGKTLACCCTLQSDTTIEADIDDEPDAEIIPVKDFAATVTRIEDLTPTIKALHLALDKPLHFQAGQYVQLEIPGLGASRAFSIANAPSEVAASGHIELHVRRVPGGVGTGWLHEQLKTGDRLRLTGPYGRFFVRQSSTLPMVFMAGGSGLSSPRSMILDLLEHGCTLPITLVYGQRSIEELYHHDQFQALAGQHPNFTYVPVLSNEPEDSAWTGARGFVHEAAKAHFGGSFAGLKAYLCGPPPMIEACIGALMQGRLFERDIYTERFLSAADAQTARSPLFSASEAAHHSIAMSLFDTRPKVSVHVAQTDETFPCASNESLLTGMLRLGRKGIPVGCVNGGCGVCKVRILEGEIKALGPISRAHVTLEEACQGYTLACRVAPTTAVHLEVAGKLNKPFSKGRAESATASPSPQQQ